MYLHLSVIVCVCIYMYIVQVVAQAGKAVTAELHEEEVPGLAQRVHQAGAEIRKPTGNEHAHGGTHTLYSTPYSTSLGAGLSVLPM